MKFSHFAARLRKNPMTSRNYATVTAGSHALHHNLHAKNGLIHRISRRHSKNKPAAICIQMTAGR